ncbi:MAG: uracil-DNA glycosylase family protein [Polaromonas sp.]
MSLHLDPRRRAMLREMGVRVWQPAEPVAVANRGVAGAGAADAATPVRTASGTATQAVAPQGGGQAAWRLGEARALYPQAAPAQGARWLVLAETSLAALNADPLQGDAGKLLGNMLRAARMNQSGAVLLAPLLRHPASGTAADLSAALADLVARAQPDLVLVMGRLAAQALLPGAAPFGKLRGQVHRLHGVNTLVTYDAHYLLHHPADKARAWDDLCLALSLGA